MIERFKIELKNNLKEINWEEHKAAEKIKKTTEIARILIKIYHDQYNDLIILTIFFIRFERFADTLILMNNAKKIFAKSRKYIIYKNLIPSILVKTCNTDGI
jgi:hypothetical protein